MSEIRPLSEIETLPTCQELIDFLIDYIDGELPPKVQGLFDQHLSLCADCRAYLDSYRQAVQMSVAVCADTGEGLPEDVPEDLVAAILKARLDR